MEKHRSYLLTLGSLLFLAVASLSSLKESRIDVYVSVFTIAYFATTAIFRPRRLSVDVVGIALFVIFSYIVYLKVAQVLFGS